MKNESIGGRIMLARLDKEITRSHLAEHIGISKESLGRYEREERQIPAVTLLKIAAVLDCSPSDLFGDPSEVIKVAEKAD